MPSDDPNSAAEIKTPLFSASLKGKDIQIRDVIGIAILLISTVTAYAMWDHQTGGAKDLGALRSEFTVALKEMVQVNRDIAQGQREMNCLIALPTEKRELQAEFCKRITR